MLMNFFEDETGMQTVSNSNKRRVVMSTLVQDSMKWPAKYIYILMK